MERHYIDAEGQRRPDRRHERHLREIFGQVYELVTPFTDPKNNWGGQSLNRLAFHAVRDHFPQLAAEDVRVLVSACFRHDRDRDKRVAAEI